MALEVGTQAPDFQAESTQGTIVLSEILKKYKAVVLYFYPKAFTSGCTRELNRFVELYDEFKNRNVEIIGVSADSVSTQKKFAEKYGAKFPLIGDKEKKVINLYGVLNERGTSAERVTFIISNDMKIVNVFSKLKKAEEHADKALEAIKQLS
ncbi:MAG: peroxiredoxin [Sulfolobaceae archaeon]|nr:peroxiredoxin [Sulfolobaceae archaeon]